jgi:hydrogenase-4 membrane subunit HyfE
MDTKAARRDENGGAAGPTLDRAAARHARWAMWASIPAFALAITPVVSFWTDHAPTANYSYFHSSAATLVPFLLIMQLGFGMFHQLGEEHFRCRKSCLLITAALAGVLAAMALGSILGRVSLLDLQLLDGDLFNDSCLDFAFSAVFAMAFCVVSQQLCGRILRDHDVHVGWLDDAGQEPGGSRTAPLL